MKVIKMLIETNYISHFEPASASLTWRKKKLIEIIKRKEKCSGSVSLISVIGEHWKEILIDT